MNTTESTHSGAQPLLFGWKNLFLVLWREVFTLLRANLCFLLFCLPVVTIPAAITALHGVCIDAIRGKRCRVLRMFADTLKKQFLASWGVFLALAALEFVSIYGAWFYFGRASLFVGFGVLGLALTAVAVVGWLMAPSCFCMLARVDLPLRDVLKNAVLLAFLNLKFSLCCGVLTLAMLAALALFWLPLLPLILLCGFSLTAYLAAYFSLYGLQRFVLTEAL